MKEGIYIHELFYVYVYRYVFKQIIPVFQNQSNENKNEPGPWYWPGDPVLSLTTRHFLCTFLEVQGK